jgi:hypothetical protein
MEAIGRKDYKAARRSAMRIRGRKDSERVYKMIDEAEENGGFITPEGYA